MASFLAYFDLLGYKKFIENNSADHLQYRTEHFGRNIERALALDEPVIPSKHPGGYLSDISKSTLNCLTFSDTVILWTNSNTLEDFEEIVKVAHKYNQFNVTLDFPCRGCIVYGDITYKPFESKNQRGGNYMLNMIYGKALVDAYSKAEGTSWAGCVLDDSAVQFAKSLGDINALLSEYTLEYDIPYKTKEADIRQRGIALRLYKKPLLITEFIEDGIRSAFTQDNKGDIVGRTKVIFDNTIEFLRAHRIKFPFYYKLTQELPDNVSRQQYGKLDEDFTHTIVNIEQKGTYVTHVLSTIKFDRDKSDRDFLDSETISADEFVEQFKKAQP